MLFHNYVTIRIVWRYQFGWIEPNPGYDNALVLLYLEAMSDWEKSGVWRTHLYIVI